MCDDVKFEKSSGNVFKDIGFSDEEAEALSFRTKLTFEVFTLLKKSRLRRVKAAKLLAVDPADISKLKNGDDDHFSLACLSDFRDRLKRYMEDRVTQKGADLIELGVPFSDPIADGPTIQRASERALTHGISLQQILEMVTSLRKKTEIPIALMSYYNPIFRMGEETFCKAAQDAGVDGVIVPDLPPEEAQQLLEIAPRYNLATIFLVAPTSPPERMQLIASVSTGFVYCVSLTGVTGARAMLSDEVAPMIVELRKHTDKPISVGFGVSTPEQATQVAQIADGVIVGSAIVNVIEENMDDEGKMLAAVKQFTSNLDAGVKQ